MSNLPGACEAQTLVESTQRTSTMDTGDTLHASGGPNYDKSEGIEIPDVSSTEQAIGASALDAGFGNDEPVGEAISPPGLVKSLTSPGPVTTAWPKHPHLVRPLRVPSDENSAASSTGKSSRSPTRTRRRSELRTELPSAPGTGQPRRT